MSLQTARPMMLPVSQIDGKKIKQMAAQEIAISFKERIMSVLRRAPRMALK